MSKVRFYQVPFYDHQCSKSLAETDYIGKDKTVVPLHNCKTLIDSLILIGKLFELLVMRDIFIRSDFAVAVYYFIKLIDQKFNIGLIGRKFGIRRFMLRFALIFLFFTFYPYLRFFQHLFQKLLRPIGS